MVMASFNTNSTYTKFFLLWFSFSILKLIYPMLLNVCNLDKFSWTLQQYNCYQTWEAMLHYYLVLWPWLYFHIISEFSLFFCFSSRLHLNFSDLIYFLSLYTLRSRCQPFKILYYFSPFPFESSLVLLSVAFIQESYSTFISIRIFSCRGLPWLPQPLSLFNFSYDVVINVCIKRYELKRGVVNIITVLLWWRYFHSHSVIQLVCCVAIKMGRWNGVT